MYIVEDFMARQQMRADGQTALFVSKTHAFEFFENNVRSRLLGDKTVINFTREADIPHRKSVNITYDTGENEIMCVRKINFFDE